MVNNFKNMTFSNSKPFGQSACASFCRFLAKFLVTVIEHADFIKHARGDFYKRMVMALLPKHVLHIVALSTGKQMIWPNTRMVVAFMQNHFTFRDLSIGQEICHTMSAGILGFRFARDIKASVTVVIPRAGPQPTIARLINLFPEAFHGAEYRIKFDQLKGLTA
jgi:hypothetical protein